MESEADEIRRRMVEDAVERHELLVTMHDINTALQSSSVAGAVAAEALTASLEHLSEKATALTQQGATWRWEKQQCQNAVANHAKLLQLLDAPALLAETVQRGMYTEALSILQHIQQATAESLSSAFYPPAGGEAMASPYAPSAPPSSSTAATAAEASPDGTSGGRNLLSTLLRRTQAALEQSMFDYVLPRLSGPLTVDSAFRLVQFLRLVTLSNGGPEDDNDTKMEELFLAARHQFISSLIDEARELPSPSNRVRKYLQVYKVQVNEVLLQHSACFSGKNRTGDAGKVSPLLRQWCRTQSARLEDVLAGDVVQINSSYELGQVWEQGYTACGSAAKMHFSIWPMLSALVVDRVATLFDAHMKRAEEHYCHSIRSFSWKPTSSSSVHATGDGVSSKARSPLHRLGSSLRGGLHSHDGTPTNVPMHHTGYRSFQSSFTGSFSNSISVAGSGAIHTDLIPPTELTDCLPLAQALNHFLHAANTLHRVMLPGLEPFCLQRIVALLQRIARDLARDADVLSTEECSIETYGQVVQAFGGLFYVHVLKCVVRLFGEAAGKKVELALAPEMARLEHVLASMEALLHHQGEGEFSPARFSSASPSSSHGSPTASSASPSPSAAAAAGSAPSPSMNATMISYPNGTPPVSSTQTSAPARASAPVQMTSMPLGTTPSFTVATSSSSSLPPPPPPPTMPAFPTMKRQE